jgi:hypothetical protein
MTFCSENVEQNLQGQMSWDFVENFFYTNFFNKKMAEQFFYGSPSSFNPFPAHS